MYILKMKWTMGYHSYIPLKTEKYQQHNPRRHTCEKREIIYREHWMLSLSLLFFFNWIHSYFTVLLHFNSFWFLTLLNFFISIHSSIFQNCYGKIEALSCGTSKTIAANFKNIDLYLVCHLHIPHYFSYSLISPYP